MSRSNTTKEYVCIDDGAACVILLRGGTRSSEHCSDSSTVVAYGSVHFLLFTKVKVFRGALRAPKADLKSTSAVFSLLTPPLLNKTPPSFVPLNY